MHHVMSFIFFVRPSSSWVSLNDSRAIENVVDALTSSNMDQQIFYFPLILYHKPSDQFFSLNRYMLVDLIPKQRETAS